MDREQLDHLWHKAMRESVEDGEMFTRYHFAKLVAAHEREACAMVCETHAPTTTPTWVSYAAAIRARGNYA
jgi:hypothetical protein